MANRNNYMNFVKHYDKIRKVLRQCYIVGLSSKTKEKSQRDYNNKIRRVRNFIDEEFLQYENINKTKYNRFYIENYTKAHNFLYDSYLIKNVDVEELKAYFLILQSLNQYDEIKNSELMKEVCELISDEDLIDKVDFDQFTERVKEKIVDLGIINKRKKGRDTILSISKDIFEDFSETEIIEIMNAISFYSNVAIISEPGYSAIDVMSDYLWGDRDFECDFESTFSFKQNFLSRILDDEVISLIGEAIKSQKTLKFSYNGKKIEAIPKEIATEYSYGRQYLIAKDLKYNNYSKYRVDKINECKIGKKYSEEAFTLSKEKNKILVEIDFYIDEKDEDYLIERIKKEGDGHLEKLQTNHFLYSIEIEDTMSILPWIRSFGTVAKVRPSENHSLDKKIRQEYKELLEKYGVDYNACVVD